MVTKKTGKAKPAKKAKAAPPRLAHKMPEEATSPATLGRPEIFHDIYAPAWVDLIVAFGGIVPLATAVGKVPQSVRRWAKGANPPDNSTIVLIRMLSAQKGVPSPV
jgi:hypothetical protein